MYYVSLVDDHVLLRQGLASLINSMNNLQVLFEADNGKDFIRQLKPSALPDLVLMDVSMPEMDGFSTARWLMVNYPHIKILALSMMDDEQIIIRMLRNGASGYILKNISPQELRLAIESVMANGTYFNNQVSNKLISSLYKCQDTVLGDFNLSNLKERELEFLKLVCTDYSYKQIADKMYVAARTVDGYREALFSKLQVKSRVGLAMFAIKSGLVNVHVKDA
jgi:DNA-binding NarL/FixJ family response regulator